jgi:TnpA family transposase
MIESVVRHCTEMEVDSHGQSTVAFAFCRLLGFQLLPRLKAIHKQKLSRPDVGQVDAYPNLRAVLTKPINWELIRQQYDQMVKYATAVRSSRRGIRGKLEGRVGAVGPKRASYRGRGWSQCQRVESSYSGASTRSSSRS